MVAHFGARILEAALLSFGIVPNQSIICILKLGRFSYKLLETMIQILTTVLFQGKPFMATRRLSITRLKGNKPR